MNVGGAMMQRRRLMMWFVPFTSIAATLGATAALAETAREYQVKAAYLSKFGHYVEWPGDVQAVGAGQPFEIGVVASDTVADELVDAVKGQMVAGRPVSVRRLAQGEALTGPGVIFVARTHHAQLEETLAAAKGRPVLTVTESDPGAASGMINFVIVDNKVRFDVVLPAVERSPLKLSARLLGVARVVKGKAR